MFKLTILTRSHYEPLQPVALFRHIDQRINVIVDHAEEYQSISTKVHNASQDGLQGHLFAIVKVLMEV